MRSRYETTAKWMSGAVAEGQAADSPYGVQAGGTTLVGVDTRSG